ncbi:hypothetical protein SAJA_12515 [Salinisphaera japonica YTM-1]|uniref:Uncharacterized protein n=1 Tax=Salinisphaera japonica YTM-1 TaxID=1209778 RepID=A0A423PJ72_9GAMM|nr:hypothetical protein SAJA_12515 [Salinisphaera japonica YTM-1]
MYIKAYKALDYEVASTNLLGERAAPGADLEHTDRTVER